jgi:Skp family chaperone for outer membrane proteins
MKLIALGAFALATLAAGAASAQTATVNHGPALTGVCIYNPQRVLVTSAAGQGLQQGLQRLAEEVRGELAPYAANIQSEAQALQQGGQAADADGSRRRQWQQRLEEAQQLEQTREQELRYTEAMQTQVIGNAASPIISAVYQERNCSILLDRNSVFLGNPAMDLTDTILQRLNTALPSMPAFSRMPVPAQPQQ